MFLAHSQRYIVNLYLCYYINRKAVGKVLKVLLERDKD